MEHSIITRDLRRVSLEDPYRLLPEGDAGSIGEYWLSRVHFDDFEWEYTRDKDSLQDAGRIRDNLAWLLEQKEMCSENEFERIVLRAFSGFDVCQKATKILYAAGSEIVNFWPQVYKGITFDEIMAVYEFCDAYDGSLQDVLEYGNQTDKFTRLIPKLGLFNSLREKNEDRSPLTAEDLKLLNEMASEDEDDYHLHSDKYLFDRCRAYNKVRHYHYFTDPD